MLSTRKISLNNEWFENAVKEKRINEMKYQELEIGEEKTKGGRGELVFAKCKKDQKAVVIKKVTTEGDPSTRKQNFIYEVSCIIFGMRKFTIHTLLI